VLAGGLAFDLAVVPVHSGRHQADQLLDPAIDRGSDRTRRLLQRWGWLHGVRTILSLASSMLFLAALIGLP